jgi:hypothetical protein
MRPARDRPNSIDNVKEPAESTAEGYLGRKIPILKALPGTKGEQKRRVWHMRNHQRQGA